jgi:hypothetical protein
MRTRTLGVILVSASFAMGAASRVQAAVTPISPVVQDPVTGRKYQLLSQADWMDSEAEAQALSGTLATINNQEEQNFVFDTFGGYGGTQRILWIGLYDPSQDANGGSHASNFVWADGEPVTYTNWDVGEPNDSSGDEFYAAMYYPNYHNPGSWNDWDVRDADPIGIPFFGVAQFVPEPGTGTLVLMAAGAMLLARRRGAVRRSLRSLSVGS